jgi:hypothetical protein
MNLEEDKQISIYIKNKISCKRPILVKPRELLGMMSQIRQIWIGYEGSTEVNILRYDNEM